MATPAKWWEADELIAPAPKATSSLLRRAVADPLVALGQGAVDLGESAVGIGSLLSGGAVGRGAQALGYDPERTRQAIGEWYSPEAKTAFEAVEQAEGVGPTLQAVAEHPASALLYGVRSLPYLGGTVAAARGAVGLVGRAAAGRGLTAAEEAARATSAARTAAGVAEGALTAGNLAEEIRRERPGDVAAMYQGAVPAGIGTALIGRLGGALEAGLATRGLPGAAGLAGGLPARVLKGAATEAAEEAAQSAQERAWTNLALERPWDQGVAKEAVLGGVVGGLLGGVMGPFAGGGELAQASAPPAVAPVVPPAVAPAADVLQGAEGQDTLQGGLVSAALRDATRPPPAGEGPRGPSDLPRTGGVPSARPEAPAAPPPEPIGPLTRALTLGQPQVPSELLFTGRVPYASPEEMADFARERAVEAERRGLPRGVVEELPAPEAVTLETPATPGRAAVSTAGLLAGVATPEEYATAEAALRAREQAGLPRPQIEGRMPPRGVSALEQMRQYLEGQGAPIEALTAAPPPGGLASWPELWPTGPQERIDYPIPLPDERSRTGLPSTRLASGLPARTENDRRAAPAAAVQPPPGDVQPPAVQPPSGGVPPPPAFADREQAPKPERRRQPPQTTPTEVDWGAVERLGQQAESREDLRRQGFLSTGKAQDLDAYGYRIVYWTSPKRKKAGDPHYGVIEYRPLGHGKGPQPPRLTARTAEQQAAVHRALGLPLGEAGQPALPAGSFAPRAPYAGPPATAPVTPAAEPGPVVETATPELAALEPAPAEAVRPTRKGDYDELRENLRRAGEDPSGLAAWAYLQTARYAPAQGFTVQDLVRRYQHHRKSGRKNPYVSAEVPDAVLRLADRGLLRRRHDAEGNAYYTAVRPFTREEEGGGDAESLRGDARPVRGRGPEPRSGADEGRPDLQQPGEGEGPAPGQPEGERAPEIGSPLAGPRAVAPRKTARQRYAERKRIDPAKDDLLGAIAKAGGISVEEARAQGIDPAEFRRRGWGVLPVFSRSGDSFDGMAERLSQYGYLSSAYTANELLDKVDRALRGQRVVAAAGAEAEAEAALAEHEADQQAAWEAEQDAPFLLDEAQYLDHHDAGTRTLSDLAQEAIDAGADEDAVADLIERGALQGRADEDIARDLRALAPRLADHDAGAGGRDLAPARSQQGPRPGPAEAADLAPRPQRQQVDFVGGKSAQDQALHDARLAKDAARNRDYVAPSQGPGELFAGPRAVQRRMALEPPPTADAQTPPTTQPAERAQRIADAIRAVQPQADRGALAYVARLREALRGAFPTKATFDEALLAEAERGMLQLQTHAWPARLSDADKETLIPNGRGGWFDAVGLRLEGGVRAPPPRAASPATEAGPAPASPSLEAEDEDLLFSRRADRLTEYRLREGYDAVPPAIRAVVDRVLAQDPDPQAVRQRLRELKGSPWSVQAMDGALARAAIDEVLAGGEPTWRSALDGSSLRALLQRRGEAGAWGYLQEYSFIGGPKKPVLSVLGSFVNCRPTRGCAEACYATTGNYLYEGNILKAELIEWAVRRDPRRAGEMAARQYQAAHVLWRQEALRLFDKGDGAEHWIPFIEALNRAGIRAHIFSKRPEFLHRVPEFNLRLLSVDATRWREALKHPDIRPAFVYAGAQDNAAVVALARNARSREREPMVLPLQGTKATRAAMREWRTLPAELHRLVCPVDSGKAVRLGTGPGEYSCRRCDKGLGVGCYFHATTAQARAAVDEILQRERAVQADPATLELHSALEELRREATRNLSPGRAESLARAVRALLADARRGTLPAGETGSVETVRGADEAGAGSGGGQPGGGGRGPEGAGPGPSPGPSPAPAYGFRLTDRPGPETVEEGRGRLEIYDAPSAPPRKKGQIQLATRVKQVRIGTFRSPLTKVEGVYDAAVLLRDLGLNAQEQMVALVVDANDRPLSVIRHSVGTTDSSQVYPGVLAGAIHAVRGAARVYLAHNHPSGVEDLSNADRNLSQRIARILWDTGVTIEGFFTVTTEGRAQDWNGERFDVSALDAAPRTGARVPVTERQYARFGVLGPQVSNPEAGKDAVRQIGGEESGVLLLNNRHVPIGWVPLAVGDMQKLRTGSTRSGASRLFRAISEANAAAAILSVPAAWHHEIAGSSEARRGVTNLHRFLKQADIRVLDTIYDRGTRSAEQDYVQFPDSDPYFQRGAPGPGLSVAQARAIADRLTRHLASAPTVHVLVDATDPALPPAVARRMAREGIDARAFLYQGEVYVFAREMRDEADLVKTLVDHEFRHYGLRGVLGKRLTPVLEAAWRGAEHAQIRAFARDQGIDTSTPRGQREAVEEYIVHLAESGQENSLLQRVFAAIREWLRRIGFDLALTDLDLRRLVAAAGTFVESGKRLPFAGLVYQSQRTVGPYATGPAPTPPGSGASAPPGSGASTQAHVPPRAGRPRPAAFARRPPWYFSAAGRAAAELPMRKATGAQWLAMLRKAPGVKPEELDWLGLPQWLEGQTGLPKEALLDFIAQRQIRIEEVVKSDQLAERQVSGYERRRRETEEALAQYLRQDPGLTPEQRYRTLEAVADRAQALELVASDAQVPLTEDFQRLAQAFRNAVIDSEDHVFESRAAPSAKPRFGRGNLVVPGGTKYHELLLTLPQRYVERRFQETTPAPRGRGYGVRRASDGHAWDLVDPSGGLVERFAAREDAELLADIRNRDRHRARPFRSDHWSEPNVLVHVRFNSRTDAEGQQVLLIEELQSDWHERAASDAEMGTGQALGYHGQFRVGEPRSEDGATVYPVVGPKGEYGHYRRRADAERRVERDNRIAVPDAPFKNAWPLLAIKRMLRWAVDHGYDRLAWTTAATHIARYQKGRFVHALRWARADDGYRIVEVYPSERQAPAPYRQPLSLPEVARFYGPEVAERLGAQKSSQGTVPGYNRQVGGEWYRGVYDKTLPFEVGKYVKRWGAKVEPIDLRFGGLVPGTVRAWSVDITTPMYVSVEQGQPLFARKPKDPWTLTLAEAEWRARVLAPRVAAAYAAGDWHAAETLDVQLEALYDRLEHGYGQLEGELEEGADREQERKEGFADEEDDNLEADLAGYYHSLYVAKDGRVVPQDLLYVRDPTPAQVARANAATLREVLADYGWKLGGLRSEVSDEEVVAAARDAYETRARRGVGQGLAARRALTAQRRALFRAAGARVIEGPQAPDLLFARAPGHEPASASRFSRLPAPEALVRDYAALEGAPSEAEIREAARQYREVETRYQDTPAWMKAPNGEPTRLNERQWVLTRTPNFKRWFGDWENDPANASKAIDGNGEPMVVYHGARSGPISAFDRNKGEPLDSGWYGPGHYFTPLPGYAAQYGAGRHGIYPVFLKLRDPIRIRHRLGNPREGADAYAKLPQAQKDKADGVVVSYTDESAPYELVVSGPNQIKSGVGNVGTFGETGDIRFARAPLDMTPAARIARARALGFDPDHTYYHATSYDFRAFDPAHTGLGTHVGTREQARDIGGTLVLPVWIRKASDDQIAQVTDVGDWSDFASVVESLDDDGVITDADVAELNRLPWYSQARLEALRQLLLRKGIRQLRYENLHEGGDEEVEETAFRQGGGESVLVLDPADLRSVFAAFDPERAEETDLLFARRKPAAAGPAAPDTPAFRAWFKNSKVVDAAGQPLRVYHGTDADFTRFGTSRSELSDLGWHYFSDNPAFAEQFAVSEEPLPQPEKGPPAPARTVELPTFDRQGTFRADAWDTATPGLLVTRAAGYERFSVTHAGGGGAVAQGIPTFAEARDLVRRLKGVADWTLGADALRDAFVGGTYDRNAVVKAEDAAQRAAARRRKDPELAALFGYKGKAGLGIGSQVMPVYLSLQNPIDLRGTRPRNLTPKAVREAFAPFGITLPREPLAFSTRDLYQVLNLPEVAAAIRRQALAQGYDGLVFPDYYDAKTRGTTYVAFAPEQIKSAVGNTGAFDPESPDIRFARASYTVYWVNPENGRTERFGPERVSRAEAERMVADLRARGWGDPGDLSDAWRGRPPGLLPWIPGAELRIWIGRPGDLERGPPPPEEPRFARRPASTGNPDLDSALAKAGIAPDPRTPIERTVDAVRDWWGATKTDLKDRILEGAFDQFHGIQTAERRVAGNLPAEQSGYVAARLSTGTSAVLYAMLHWGAPRWGRNALEPVPGSKGLLEVLAPVKDDLRGFFGWMIGRRARRLLQEGREHLFSEAEIAALEALHQPAYDRVAADFAAYKRAVLDLAEGAGLVNPATRAAWDHADWIPFYRLTEADRVQGPHGRRGLSHQSSGIRTLQGGTEALGDPLENLVLSFAHLVDASLKNHALRQTVTNLLAEPNGVLEPLPATEFARALVPRSEVKRILREAGADPAVLATLPPEAFDGIGQLWSLRPPKDPDVIRVMEAGKSRYFRVHDAALLRGLTAVNQEALGGLVKPLRAFKRLLTAAVTADPAFMLRNFVRDALHAWTISEHAFRPGVDSVRGALKTLRESGGLRDMMFAGASFMGGYVNAGDPGEVACAIRRALRARGYDAAAEDRYLATLLDTPARFWEKYRSVGDAIENANREATFEATLRATGSPTEAAYQAKDLMDYSMRGNWTLFRLMGDVLPFFNARLQGLYKLGRAGALTRPQVLARGALIALFSLALLALNRDNDDYEALEEWDKDANWHFWLPDGQGGAQHLRLPKPFEIGLLYGTVPERVARNLLGRDDPGKSFERLLWAVRDTLAFDPVPQAVKPIAELYANRDAFTGRPIEGLADAGKRPFARYDETTSATMRALGAFTSEATGVSPKQLEHLWRGYLGALGAYALEAADIAVRWAEGGPPRAARRWDEVPVVKAFVRESPAFSTRYRTELYEMAREAEQLYRTVRALREEGRAEEARALAETNAETLSARPGLKRATEGMSQVRAQMDRVQRAADLNPEEKRARLDELIGRRNEVAKAAVERVEGAAFRG